MLKRGTLAVNSLFSHGLLDIPFSMRERMLFFCLCWASNCRCQFVSEDARRINSDASKPRGHVSDVTTLLGRIEKTKIKDERIKEI